jgi:hypothetical protein
VREQLLPLIVAKNGPFGVKKNLIQYHIYHHLYHHFYYHLYFHLKPISLEEEKNALLFVTIVTPEF